MNLNLKHYRFRIFISLMLWLWGIYTIKVYDIALMESIWDQVDGWQHVISTITASDNFFNALINKYDFVKSSYLDDEMNTFLCFMYFSVSMQIILSKIYQGFLYYKTKDDLILIKIISFITNFFLMFVANDIILILFDMIYEGRFFLAKVMLPFFDFFESPSIYVILLTILFLFIIVVIYIVVVRSLILWFLQEIAIFVIYAIIIHFELNISVFLSIVITVSN